MDVPAHDTLEASPWVQRWSQLVSAEATVLDVACGGGRHARWFAKRGCRVTGVDRDAAALGALVNVAETVAADIERGPWPFAARRFDAVIVTNYLWRALLPTLVASVDDGGVLIYETFAEGQASVGKPSNPDFLLRPGELLQAVRGLRVIAFEDGFLDAPARFVQRIVAVRERPGAAGAARYRL
ncbi:class I SAM-dependent methyltransferase [Piscinibacter sp.]|jgi:SAM-dependent methyltransferase|uniref:class I SAM-dependent methyltransferase n=1 Tax=Piscinibacter sp. TaxID=1903157 RepID=UPI002F411B6C